MNNDIILLGDISFNGLISDQPEKNTQRFKRVAPVLQDAGLVFANLESPVKGNGEVNLQKRIIHYTDEAVTRDLLSLLNIKCVSLANNHIYDCLMSGVKSTIYLLDELGIYHTGAGWLKEHVGPVLINFNNQQIGFLAYVDISTNPKTEKSEEFLINYFDIDKVLNDVSRVRPFVDRVICSIHWGLDFSFFPTDYQVKVANMLINNGVDVIMGHHSHTIQPYTKVSTSKYIFYSLGSFCYGDHIWNGRIRGLKTRSKKSFIVKLNKNFCNVKFIPIIELKGNSIDFRKGDFTQWSNRKWAIYKLFKIIPLLKIIVKIHNRYWVKFYNFFFGYYRNPFLGIIDIFIKTCEK